MTVWNPDTCDCEIEISDDQTSPLYGEAIRHIKVCAAHVALGMNHTAVHAENRRKNMALADILAAHPGLTGSSGSLTSAGPAWSFNSSRTVTFTTGLSQADTAQLQAQFNSKYGAGKVKVS